MTEETHGGETHGGGCLCGAVRYEVRGPLRQALVCHCAMCQKTHGVPAAYSAAANETLRFPESRGLAWFRSSPQVERGFCRHCGASLFWRREGAGYTSIACGSLDRPSGVAIAGHIFVGEKGDYYEIHDGLPQFEKGTGGKVPGAPSVI